MLVRLTSPTESLAGAPASLRLVVVNPETLHSSGIFCPGRIAWYFTRSHQSIFTFFSNFS